MIIQFILCDNKHFKATASNVDLVGTYLTFVRDDTGSGTLKVYVSTNKADYGNGTTLHTFTGYSRQ